MIVYLFLEGIAFLLCCDDSDGGLLREEFFNRSSQITIEESGLRDFCISGRDIPWPAVDNVTMNLLQHRDMTTGARLVAKLKNGKTMEIDIVALDQDPLPILFAVHQAMALSGRANI